MSEFQQIEVNGEILEFPSDMSDAEIEKILAQQAVPQEAPAEGSPAEAPAEYQQFAQVKQDVDPSTLAQDQDWLNASREVYKMNQGKAWEGNDEDLAEYGLDVMGWFNYNLPKMGLDAARVRSAEQRQKEAFLYLMDTYDNLDMSWGGVGRFFKGVLADPTTYIGLGTLGIGTAASAGGKAATKQGIKELLKQGTRAGTVAGVEGALYAGTDSTIRQTVEVSAGRREEVDNAKVAVDAGVGAAVGFVGGTALDAAVTKITQAFKKSPVEAPATTPETPSVRPEQSTSAFNAPEPKEAPKAAPEAPAEDIPAEAPKPDGGTNVPAPGNYREGDVFEYTKLEDLPLPKAKTTIPYERQKLQDNVNKAFNLARELKNLSHLQVEDVAEQLQTKQMTVGELEEFSLSTKLARDWSAMELAQTVRKAGEATDPAEIARLTAKQDELQATFDKLSSMDEALGSHAGYLLRQRQVGLQGDLSDSTDLTVFTSKVFRAEEDAKVKARKAEYDQKIQLALTNGDMAEAAHQITLKGLEVDGIVDQILKDRADQSLGKKSKRTVAKLVELSIANVFSPVTVLRNAVPPMLKVVYRPALDAILSNPFEAATRKQLAATYGAMRAGHRSAFKAALAAFKYEQAILTRESGRLLEGELAISGHKGGFIRFLPRILNTTDEYFSQLTYRGFIAGRTAGDAYEEAVKQGLKGKAIDRHINQRVKEAIDQSYATAATEESIRTVLNKGVSLGYTGEGLAHYVKREIQKNPEALRHGHDKEAIDFARDMLYKRQFSGEGTASSLAQWYEKVVNDHPIIRLFGQLFFRTPVRVFEEGVRMTPGLQVVAPNFLADLAGKNGRRAQVRAQGEAMMSLGFTSVALTLYSQGRITGDGAYSDWKQQRTRTDGPLPEPYTIILDDGTTFSYKNLDPIATPLKIMVNAFERYDRLTMLERQGEFTGKEREQAIAALYVATGAIGRAFADANLLGGLAGIEQALTVAFDEEGGGEAAAIKFIGEKLRMAAPNTMHKIAQSNDPTIDDPADWWQMVESRLLSGATLGAYEKSVPKSYDALGNVRQNADTGAMWNMFSPSTPEDRMRGLTPDQAKVLEKLDFLSKQTGAVFSSPTKHKLLGNVDMRKTLTADGKETLQDRWNRYYRELHPENYLLPILESALPVGTNSVNGAKVTETQATINSLREAALMRLISEEAGVEQTYLKNIQRKAEAEAGFWDQ